MHPALRTVLLGFGGRVPSGLAAELGNLGDAFVFRMGGAVAEQGQPSQGLAIDSVGRKVYVIREVAADTSSLISCFRLDGPRAQAAESSSAETTIPSHQGLAVEQLAGGGIKLWSTARSNGNAAVRFDYVASGAPANVETYTLFSDQTSVSIYPFCSPAVSSDGLWLIANWVTAGGMMVRVWSLPTLIAGGPGDYSTQATYQWTVSGFQSDATYPLQVIASDGRSITLVAGFGNSSPTPLKFRRYSLAGALLDSKEDFLPYALDWVSEDPAGAGASIWEPEGVAYDGSTPYILSSTGTTPDRVNRVWRMGSAVRQDADALNTTLLAAMTAAGSTPSASMQAIYREFYSDLIAADLYRRMGCVWVLAAETEAQAKINLMDPGVRTLTKVGAPVFTAKSGYAGTGSTANYLDTGGTYTLSPNYTRKAASIGVWSGSSGRSSGSAIGTTTGSYVFLHTRDANDASQSRLNSTAAVVTTANGSVLDASGLWSLNRADNTGFRICRNGATLATNAQTTNAMSTANVVLLRSQTGATDALIRFAYLGYTKSEAQEAAFYGIVAELMASIDAL